MRTLGDVLLLVALLLNTVAAVRWVKMTRDLNHQRAEQFRRADAAITTAATLTYKVIDRCSPYLDCQDCGARLDARVGIAVDDDDDQLHLRCGDCAAQAART